MKLVVRIAELPDAAVIARIHVSTWQHAYRDIMPREFLDSRKVEEFTDRWKKNLVEQSEATRLNFVAELDGTVAGFVSAGVCRDRDAIASVGEIYALYVLPAHWGTGAGRALMGHGLDFLRERGYSAATLWVLRDNPRARRFYELAGMALDGATKTDQRMGFEMHEVRYRTELEKNMFDRFSHVMMYVKDMKRALEFYKGKLGFVPNFESPHFSSLRHEKMGCRLDLHPSEANSKDVGFGPIPYFLAKDFDGALAKLKKLGVKVGEPRREGDSPRFVSFWDSEGNALGLEEPR
jgi:ribosomal protein S18 acetylase RimI-like enzyme/predicted enzyme related to lactoylglutathione lyase